MASMRTTVILPVAPKALYKAWLSSREHSAMTGGKAKASPRKSGRFTAWDDHIRGKNLKLKPHWCIVQSWRTSEFPNSAKDTQIELCIHPSGKTDTKLIFIHSKLTPKQVRQYRAGWRTHYWKPMKKYFASNRRRAR